MSAPEEHEPDRPAVAARLEALRTPAPRSLLSSGLRRLPRLLLGAVLAWGAQLAVWGSALAHPLSPAALLLVEQRPGLYQAKFRRPMASAALLELALPASCERGAATTLPVRAQLEDTFELTCPGSLAGQTLSVGGLDATGLSAIVYVEFASGQQVRGLLSAQAERFTLPEAVSAHRVFVDYLQLGMEHLLLGADHLLFVLGLSFLVRELRPLVLTLTAFTLGHSLTLCLLALSLVQVNAAAVEVGIALSLVVLALSLLRQQERDSEAQHAAQRTLPWLALNLGLLHGLGFAGALAETGLPEHQIPLSLLGFNLGIECAQLLVVLGVAALRRLLPHLFGRRAQQVMAYAMGAIAAMWCIERGWVWFS